MHRVKYITFKVDIPFFIFWGVCYAGGLGFRV
jgi:hypothetical protein